MIMRKLFTAIVVAFIALTTLSSCNKVLEGDFTFNCSIMSNMTSGSEDRFNEIVDIIKKDSFFTEDHSYHATYSDACTQVANAFISKVLELDQDAIQAKLIQDEYVQLVLANKANGEIVAYVGWTANPAETGEE